MADEVNLQFVMPGAAEQVQADWRANPPPPFDEFELKDESFNGLVYRSVYLDAPAKLMTVLSFGLMGKGEKNTMASQWNLRLHFAGEGHTRTKVTIIGNASEGTRAKLAQLAEQHGGAVGLRVGV